MGMRTLFTIPLLLVSFADLSTADTCMVPDLGLINKLQEERNAVLMQLDNINPSEGEKSKIILLQNQLKSIEKHLSKLHQSRLEQQNLKKQWYENVREMKRLSEKLDEITNDEIANNEDQKEVLEISLRLDELRKIISVRGCW